MTSRAADGQIVRAFERFALSGYKHKFFTVKLYDAFSRSFGFIAHYNRNGFFEARFGSPSARISTLAGMSARDAWYSNRALEKALRVVVAKHGLFEAAAREHDAEIVRRERAELARLKAKYELEEEPRGAP
jgi:hypothetical protein